MDVTERKGRHIQCEWPQMTNDNGPGNAYNPEPSDQTTNPANKASLWTTPSPPLADVG